MISHPLSLDTALTTIEAQLQDIQTALLAADPLALEPLAQRLRNTMAALSQAFAHHPEPPSPPIRQRAQALASQLNQVRDQLARLLALTQQQAASLLPPIDHVTYGSAATPGARIYRAPG